MATSDNSNTSPNQQPVVGTTAISQSGLNANAAPQAASGSLPAVDSNANNTGQTVAEPPISDNSVAATADVKPEASDLIDKEWIDKAKKILSSFANDPRKQAININRLRADYLQKRYNKDIKVSDE